MKSILIIGASGYTGYYTAKLAVKKGHQVSGTYNFRPILIPEVEMHHLEKARDYQTNDLIKKIQPEVVIDCAALHNADFCEEHSDLAYVVNISGTANVARACRQNNARMIYVSTDYVFNGKDNLNSYKETDPISPINVYGKTKSEAEKYIQNFLKNYVIARPSDIYGWNPHQYGDLESSSKKSGTFAEWVIKSLRNYQEINLFTDQYNNSTYVGNLAEMLIEFAENDLTGIFHTPGLTCQNRLDQGLKIAKVFRLNANLINPISSDSINQKAKRPKNLCLNTEKVRGSLNTKLLDIESGITEMMKSES